MDKRDRYSKAFRKNVKNKKLTVLEAGKYYGEGFPTIYRWLKKVNYDTPCKEVIFVQLSDQYPALQEIEEIKQKILGYNVAQTLLAEESVKVMRKTLKKYKLPKDCIHHSDKGVQYTSKLYTDFLKKNNFRRSMTGAGKCYDNACAERVFNTLKNEFGFNVVFSSLKEVRRELKNFVDIYNNKRYHMSLDYRTPQSVFLEMQKAA